MFFNPQNSIRFLGVFLFFPCNYFKEWVWEKSFLKNLQLAHSGEFLATRVEQPLSSPVSALILPRWRVQERRLWSPGARVCSVFRRQNTANFCWHGCGETGLRLAVSSGTQALHQVALHGLGRNRDPGLPPGSSSSQPEWRNARSSVRPEVRLRGSRERLKTHTVTIRIAGRNHSLEKEVLFLCRGGRETATLWKTQQPHSWTFVPERKSMLT